MWTPRGEREGGVNWGTGTDIYIYRYVHNRWLMRAHGIAREFRVMLCGGLNGRQFKMRGCVYRDSRLTLPCSRN